MADIELVINITEHEWEYLNKLVKNGDQLGHYERLLVNGMPLPKGHGRLIDADAIEYDKESLETDSSQVFLVVDKDSIDLMPTIVEAEYLDSKKGND